MNSFELSSIPAGSHIHFIGIGGISMSALAEVLLSQGYVVSGSDRCESNLTNRLKSLGAKIYIGQSSENIKNPALVVYTAAISNDNEELAAARLKGILTIERPVLLGAIMKLYKYPVAVSGTHGKTTTTSMLTHILFAADTDPTIFLGGELNIINGNVHVSKSDYFVCEACEYHESFLSFFPYITIILNIEEDHLDYYSGIDDIISSFKKLIALTPDNGATIINADNENAVTAAKDSDKKIIKVSIKNNAADYVAKNISYSGDNYGIFDVYRRGECIGSVNLSVPGEHNIYNALTCIAAADILGIDFKYIAKGLNNFDGVHRRFEFKGEKNGIKVIDDYAHHPTEIRTTLSSALSSANGKIWCVFQPHTYTRTHALFDDFVSALSCGVNIIIADIYSAREKDTGLVSSAQLAEKIENAVNINDFAECVSYLEKNAKKGDTIITMGAGDVYKIGEMFLEN